MWIFTLNVEALTFTNGGRRHSGHYNSGRQWANCQCEIRKCLHCSAYIVYFYYLLAESLVCTHVNFIQAFALPIELPK